MDCASVLHFSMWNAAFLIVDVSVSIFKQSNLRMHCFSYFIWIRQKGLSKGLKKNLFMFFIFTQYLVRKGLIWSWEICQNLFWQLIVFFHPLVMLHRWLEKSRSVMLSHLKNLAASSLAISENGSVWDFLQRLRNVLSQKKAQKTSKMQTLRDPKPAHLQWAQDQGDTHTK